MTTVVQELSIHIENALRARWGTYYFGKWLNEEAENHIIRIYEVIAKDHPESSLLARNLYYAMESYIYFTDANTLDIKDLIVFLERIVKKQFE
jgi:hypothetical protein